MYTEKTNVLWRVTLGAGLINVILNFSLLPIYGFEVNINGALISSAYGGDVKANNFTSTIFGGAFSKTPVSPDTFIYIGW